MLERLFARGTIGNLELNNRIIKAPQCLFLAARDGSVTDRLVRHYQEVASGGVALVIVEFTFIDHEASQGRVCQLSIADDSYIPGLSILTQIIHRCGAKAALQIVHCGEQRYIGTPIKAPSPNIVSDPVTGSRISADELTSGEIHEITTSFGNAARRAQIAGFDMVELHGAHGYLITNFLSPKSNRRIDSYGGCLDNRMRFLQEVIIDIRKKVSPEFPLGVRLSATEYEPDGIQVEDTIKVARILEELGVDAIHVCGGNHRQRLQRNAPMSIPPGPMIWAAEILKKEVSIPVIASGSITTPELAEEVLEKGKADFVALGRPLLADPYWPLKAKEGRLDEIVPCIRCNEGCLYRSMTRSQAITCTMNVTLGVESEMAIRPAGIRQRVAVIGGGPAGMEAARVCKLRGHDVSLYEKRKLGGALIEASVPEFKSDLRRLLRYLTTQIDKLKIDIILEEATPDLIRDSKYDVVIVAAGASPLKLDVLGADSSTMTFALEVLNGNVSVGNRVVVLGGGVVGTETGLFLAEQGKEVILVELTDVLMKDIGFLDQIVYQERLAKQKVTIFTCCRVEAITNLGVEIVDQYGKHIEIPVDSIVVAIGFIPQISLTEQLNKVKNLEVYAIGDCVKPRKIYDAIHEGYLAALWI